MRDMSNTRKQIAARLGMAAKATFGVWGDVPSQYRAAVDLIRKQSRPSSAAMNELKKAIKQRLAYAAQELTPSERQMYQDDAGSLENVLEYAQQGNRATLLRSAYNMDTAVRDDVPNEMFIWAGGDVNWSHPNVKAMLERVSRKAGPAKPTKRSAMRPGAKARMAVDRKKVIRDLEYLRDEARRTRNDSARIDAENWLKNVRKGGLTEQDWIEAESAASYISEEVQGRFSRPGAKAKMAVSSRDELMLRTWIRNNYPNADNATFNKMLAKMLKEYAKDPNGYTYGGGFRAVAKAAGFSRPGAKATAAKTTMAAHSENIAWMRSLPASVVNQVRSILQKPHSSARAKALRDALKAGGVGFNQFVPDASAGAEVLGHQFREAFAKTTDLEREDVKAGLKLMAASDEAVSNKIRTLIAEGKPQDQAVAIALDMKRRGEI